MTNNIPVHVVAFKISRERRIAQIKEMEIFLYLRIMRKDRINNNNNNNNNRNSNGKNRNTLAFIKRIAYPTYST